MSIYDSDLYTFMAVECKLACIYIQFNDINNKYNIPTVHTVCNGTGHAQVITGLTGHQENCL